MDRWPIRLTSPKPPARRRPRDTYRSRAVRHGRSSVLSVPGCGGWSRTRGPSVSRCRVLDPESHRRREAPRGRVGDRALGRADAGRARRVVSGLPILAAVALGCRCIALVAICTGSAIRLRHGGATTSANEFTKQRVYLAGGHRRLHSCGVGVHPWTVFVPVILFESSSSPGAQRRPIRAGGASQMACALVVGLWVVVGGMALMVQPSASCTPCGLRTRSFDHRTITAARRVRDRRSAPG